MRWLEPRDSHSDTQVRKILKWESKMADEINVNEQ